MAAKKAEILSRYLLVWTSAHLRPCRYADLRVSGQRDYSPNLQGCGSCQSWRGQIVEDEEKEVCTSREREIPGEGDPNVVL